MDHKSNVDNIWRSLGTWGRYQCLQVAIILFTLVAGSFQLLNVVFIGYRPSHQCQQVANISSIMNVSSDEGYHVTYGKCSIRINNNGTNRTSFTKGIECKNGFQYSLDKYSTFVTEFDLVCGRAGLAELTQTMVMTGQLIGAAVAASLGDRFGRKTIHFISHICIMFCGVGVAFSTNYTVLILLRLLSGILQQGIIMAGAILMLELLPTETRYTAEVLGILTWTTALCLMSLIAYLLRDISWRYLQLTLSLYSSFSLVQFWIQDESLRWLLVNGKFKEAERIVRKAARMNKVSYGDIIQKLNIKDVDREDAILVTHNPKTKSENTFVPIAQSRLKVVDGKVELEECKNETEIKPDMDKSNEVKHKAEHNNDIVHTNKEAVPSHIDVSDAPVIERYNVFTIIKSRRLLTNSLILWFIWITNSLTYFGLTLTATSLAGNRHLNFFINSATEYVSAFLLFNMLPRIGRRTIAIIFHAIAGICLVLATLLNYFADGNAAMVTSSVFFTFMGKMAISGSFSTMFLYTPELFPTNVRNVGIGLSSSVARTGGMLAPFASILALHVAWGPGAIFATMCFIVTFIIFYLPETRGVELPTTIKELKSWYKYKNERKRITQEN